MSQRFGRPALLVIGMLCATFPVPLPAWAPVPPAAWAPVPPAAWAAAAAPRLTVSPQRPASAQRLTVSPQRPASAQRLPGAPSTPARGWHADNEWALSGNYAEACTDPPLCPGLFGAAPCGGPCRKVMIFQILSGRYQNTDLAGLTAVAAIESPADAAITPASRAAWPRCDLLISDQADSAAAYGIRMTLGAMLLGAGGPGFTRVETVPLRVLFSGARVTAESPGRLTVHIRPGASLNKVTAPDLNNLGSSFPFLGSLYIYETDTLYYAAGSATAGASDAGAGAPVGASGAGAGAPVGASGAGSAGAAGAGVAPPPFSSHLASAPGATTWNCARRSGVVSQFTWNSKVAYEEAATPDANLQKP